MISLVGINILLLANLGGNVLASGGEDVAGIEWLADTMDQYHGVFSVYVDASAGGNNFNCRGFIGSSDDLVSEKQDFAIDPHSGLTCIRISVKASDRQWAGCYYMNGILQGNDRHPSPNWGDTPNAGVDLTGANKLTFWAKGETGTEQIEFFALGVGRDQHTGTPIKPHPDSSPKIGTGLITLSADWTMYTLDLSTSDLSYVLGGFGWSASTKASTATVFYLDDIYYDLQRLHAPRFLNSYKAITSDITARSILPNAAYTYDNAVAMIAFLAVGENERARLIADALVYAQNHDRYFDDGRIRNAYQSGHLIVPPGWAPYGKAGTVRMPGGPGGKKWLEDQQAVGTDTGNMAWSILALLACYDINGGSRYLDAAIRMGDWIENKVRDERGNGGYVAGYSGTEPNQVPLQYKSTEHNLDLYPAFKRLSAITGDPRWNASAAHAYNFVMSMWNHLEGRWHVGTTKDGVTINPHRALDCQPWALLALKDLPRSYEVALQFAERFHRVPGAWGFDFDDDQDGIWFEGTAQMATAYMLTGQEDKAAKVLSVVVGGRAPSGGMYATNVAMLTTGLDNPDGSDWVYYHRQHVGAAAWAVIAQTRTNPFWLGTPFGKIFRQNL